MKSAEQEAREMLDRMDIEGALNFSAGEVVELANLIRRSKAVRIPADDMREQFERAFHHTDTKNPDGTYLNIDVQAMWVGWRAALEALRSRSDRSA